MQQDTNGVKSAAAVAKWRLFGLSRLLNKAIITDFSPHTVRGGIVNLEYEKKNIFYSENTCLCFVRLNGHLVSLCLADAIRTKWEKMLLYFPGMLWGWTCITNWHTVVMGISKGPEAERRIQILNTVRIQHHLHKCSGFTGKVQLPRHNKSLFFRCSIEAASPFWDSWKSKVVQCNFKRYAANFGWVKLLHICHGLNVPPQTVSITMVLLNFFLKHSNLFVTKAHGSSDDHELF